MLSQKLVTKYRGHFSGTPFIVFTVSSHEVQYETGGAVTGRSCRYSDTNRVRGNGDKPHWNGTKQTRVSSTVAFAAVRSQISHLGLQENHAITIAVNTVILGVCRDSWQSP